MKREFHSVEDLSQTQREHFEVAESFRERAFSRSEYFARYGERFPNRPEGSILPSDFCWNNNQKAKDEYPSFLEWLSRGEYRFIGLEKGAALKRAACPTADRGELERRTEKLIAYRERSERLHPGSLSVPVGKLQVPVHRVETRQFLRSPDVIAWVRVNADGRCEVCQQRAPFDDRDGRPHLEVHHVRPLSQGGPDTIDNAIACCPNCHRQLHLGREADLLRKHTLNVVERLKDYPEKGCETGDE